MYLHFVLTRTRQVEASERTQHTLFVRALAISTALLLHSGYQHSAAGGAEEGVATIDFARDIRPILSDKCFHCHGPDDESRQADLRLDIWDSSDDLLGASEVVVGGEPESSELIARIASEDADSRMPPADSPKTLRPEEIELLRQWIAQGASFQPHWAFSPPIAREPPSVGDSSWSRNEIDHFVMARLDKENLKPSRRAGAHVLLRRLSLDLVGLPPTPEDLADFEKRVSELGLEKAYAWQVNKLLESQHYGERWGRVWLDTARYADSDGYEKDKPRDVWMYRDWVIQALNQDMPYDQFVVRQIAGDMLPDASVSDQIATGFLRNSMTNAEGGIDPEQFRMETMFDRMDAIGKSVLGITLQCAQCHTHKYDPITHTDYYRLFAFLNNCHEKQITVYDANDLERRQQILSEIERIEGDIKSEHPDWQMRLAEWENHTRKNTAIWDVVRPAIDTSGAQKHSIDKEGAILAEGYVPSQFTSEFSIELRRQDAITAVRLELLTDPSLPHGGPGRSIDGLCALSEFTVLAAPLSAADQSAEVKIARATADVNPYEKELDKSLYDDRSGQRRVTGPIAFAIDHNETTAWGIDIGPGRSNVPRKAVFVFEKPIDASQGVRLTFQLAQRHGETNEVDTYNQCLGRFRLSVTSESDPVADPLPANVRQALQIPFARQSPTEQKEGFSYWRSTVKDWDCQNLQIEHLWKQHPRGTSQLVVAERSEPRVTHRLDRGSFLTPAEEVSPGVPTFLNPLAGEQPTNRLAFAQWLVDRRSPTAARSIVNRVWQAYFGIGLTATPEDLGTQGEPPSHPELLDWLSVDFMNHGWSLKRLHRQIVSSATYQQLSNVTPEQLAVDPENRLLERGARFRVDAEMVRDIALASSNLINLKVGGPSVYPPAPEFLFSPPSSFAMKRWHYDQNAAKFRRALYTFRYRSIPYPVLQAFDAPSGEVACARRPRSNTPLQALATLNEELFMECARSLAHECVARSSDGDSERLKYIMQKCVGRIPDRDEAEMLANFVTAQRKRFKAGDIEPYRLANFEQASADLVQSDEADRGNAIELATWTAVARVILNLDETLTKE